MSNPKLAEMAKEAFYKSEFASTSGIAVLIINRSLEQAYQLGVTDGLKEGLSCPGKEIEEAEESGFKRGLDQGIELGRAEENEEIAKFIENNCQFVECEEECECSKVIRSRMKEKP